MNSEDKSLLSFLVLVAVIGIIFGTVLASATNKGAMEAEGRSTDEIRSAYAQEKEIAELTATVAALEAKVNSMGAYTSGRSIDVADLLTAIRAESDLLLELDERHASNDGSLYIRAMADTGASLSRVYNRLVNGCEYVTYKTGVDEEGKEKWWMRRVDLACADR